jgi:hypothetical protein
MRFPETSAISIQPAAFQSVNALATKYWLGLPRRWFLSGIANRLEDVVSLTRVSSRKVGCDLHVVHIVLRYHLRTHVNSQISHVAPWESVLRYHPKFWCQLHTDCQKLIPVLANCYWLSSALLPLDSKSTNSSPTKT